jgi:hypothetical protein
MNISDEAVEAALDALLGVFQQGANGGVYIQGNSDTDWVVDGIADLPLAVRKAVEAAAPHLMAQAWDAGVKAERQWRTQFAKGGEPTDPANPYRAAGAGE